MMDVKCLMIISFVLAILAIGTVGASQAADALVNESMAIEDNEMLSGNGVEVNLHNDECIDLNNDSVLAEITAPGNATGEVNVFVGNNLSFTGDLTTFDYIADENDSDTYVYRIALANLATAFQESTYFINVTYGGDDYYQPDFDEGNVTMTDLRKDVEYKFFLDITDDYVLGTENILMLSVPVLSNKCILTLDTPDNVLYDFYLGGLGWMINVGGWNLTPGKHVLNLSYPGDDEYKPFSATIEFTCAFINVSIGEEMIYPQLALTFANDATGKVQIFVDGKWYMNKTVEEFRNDEYNSFPHYEPIYTYNVYLNGLGCGNHTYKVIYCDDEKYVLDSPIEGKFNVTYEFDAIEIDTNGIHYVGDVVKFGIFADDDVKKVIVQYNGKIIEVIPNSDDYYDAVVAIPDLNAGENNITFTSQSDNRPSKSILKSVYMNPVEEPQDDVVSKKDPKITANNLKAIYSEAVYYKVRVYGDDGKPAKAKVTFLIDGKAFKTVNSNANGFAVVKITKKPGNYKITVKSLGKSVTRKLTVDHILKLKIVKAKKSSKKLVVKASLAKINGKYLKGKKITLKVNGKKFTAKTNKKGVAKFTIKKFKGGKKIKFQATYLKDTVKRTVKV